MASINQLGNVTSKCPGCSGALSTFEWAAVTGGGQLGFVQSERAAINPSFESVHEWRLFRCAGCGRGGLGLVNYVTRVRGGYPGTELRLIGFIPESMDVLRLPAATPEGIRSEFREAEKCMENGCYRAAAGLFRSVLDKVMRANGYKTKELRSLADQIDAATADKIITESRQRRAHAEVRVLGNDVLHDEWHEIEPGDVEASHHYCQRILEDFYDDRATVEAILVEAERITVEPVA